MLVGREGDVWNIHSESNLFNAMWALFWNKIQDKQKDWLLRTELAESEKQIEMKCTPPKNNNNNKKNPKNSFIIVSELNKKQILQASLILLKYCKQPHKCFILIVFCEILILLSYFLGFVRIM